MSPESVHTILEPLLLAVALSLAVFAIAILLLWRDGRRQKRELEPGEPRPSARQLRRQGTSSA